MSDEDEVPEEIRFIPGNSVDGPFTGIQVGIVNGDVRLGGDRVPRLVVLRATSAELDDVRHHFTPPGGYGTARRVLLERGVVVLTGHGAGRSYTARRLLVEAGVAAVAEANPELPLGAFHGLAADTGYVWDVRDSARDPFDRAEFERVERLVRATGSRLVIVLDEPVRAPSSAAAHVVPLTAPPAFDVAREELRRRCPDDHTEPLRVLVEDLALEDGASPEKAVRAADLAVRVHRGLDRDTALQALREHVEQAVERHLAERTDLEFALSFAVALLENQPYDEVVARALTLAEALRATSPDDEPPRAFSLSKRDVLTAVAATTTVRDHPDYPGLAEETVHFTRQGWADAVLRKLWRDYPLAHDVLWRWMSDRDMTTRFADAVQRAVVAIVTGIPAHEPLRLVHDLARRGAVAHQELAAKVVARLDGRYRDLVSRTVESWTTGTAYEQATAVWFSLAPSESRPLAEALRRLELIARSAKATPRNAVVAAVLELLRTEEHRADVLDRVESWLANRRLAHVALPLAMWITGYYPYALAVELTEAHPARMRALAHHALTAPESRDAAVERLVELADEARLRDSSAARLVHLTLLLTPTFRWPARHRAVVALSAAHPASRGALRHAFRVAARVGGG
ncbi:hypothetical protein [Saccharothrix obliqua]|uniref:hypothetical protein n=1 Tax=Saccharothrix obliqua TaxID=2861747 RepID=UPI001C5E3DF7|nr:hypothetical protein [Saccharothrix obliqua]MBW4717121.1 hypothetical protein [Saccharothrix obliqua]